MKIKVFVLIFFTVFLFGTSFAQKKSSKKITISGFVIDTARQPVAGAMILVDKMNSNIVTDSKGYYRVKVMPDAEKITVFTINGGNSDELINGRTSVNFTIESAGTSENNDKFAADEETINIGYGEVKRKDLTMSVDKVKGIGDNQKVYTDIYDMLRGTIPGVRVNGKNITIQGVGTFNGDSQPLFVLDGTIISTIDDIPPGSVKSIEVLKGAAASIYGSRGANGVILIRLKSHGDK